MKEQNGFGQWVKKHKMQLIAALGCAAVTALIIVAANHPEEANQLLIFRCFNYTMLHQS